MHAREVRTRRLRHSVLEAGVGGRPLLLVHGFTGAKEDFADFLGRLADLGWHVVSPDLRGHGASEKPDRLGDYSLQTMSDDLGALADELGWSSFVLLGHSMGGMVAQIFALSCPERVQAMILMNTTAERITHYDPDIIELAIAVATKDGMARLAEVAAEVEQGTVAPSVQRLFDSKPEYRRYGDEKMANTSPVMFEAMAARLVDQPSRLEALHELEIPVLVMLGSEDVNFVDSSRALAEVIPGADYVEIPDAAHCPQFENPEAWWRALADFLTGPTVALAGQRVVVMGLGNHGGGAGMVDFLLEVGAEVVLSESSPREGFDPEIIRSIEARGVSTFFGGHDVSHLGDADLLIRNPAVRSAHPLLVEARRRAIPIEMEMTLFFRWWKGRSVGVTGTKGKSTTTTLCDAVLSQAGPTFIAGNLRVSAIGSVLDGRVDPNSTAVLELSSFQLEGMGERAQSPDIAVITNLDEDHLDAYANLEEYWQAKAAVYRDQGADGVLILPANDQQTLEFVGHDLAQIDRSQRPKLRYFSDAPLAANELGAWLADGALWVRRELGNDRRVVEIGDLSIESAVARLDLCAALCVGVACGLSDQELAAGAIAAREVRDRMETVARFAEIQFVNDTTATAPRAGVASVRSFDAKPLAVICGGKDKGSSLEAFAAALGECAAAIVLLTHPNYDASERLAPMLDSVGAKVLRGSSMPEAVGLAVSALGPDGGVVLLSPAAASFGMFDNEFHRGDEFRAAVEALESRAR